MMDLETTGLRKMVADKEKQVADLHVLIDTLQTNLRSAASVIPEDIKDSITEVQSFKWCINWRPEMDEMFYDGST